VSELGRIELGPDDGQCAVVKLVGAIDLSVSQRLRGVLDSVTAPNVVVDMQETTFIDSVTIGALVAARKPDRTVTLYGASNEILATLERSGVTQLFTIRR
jgi:anti-anti-sigma factor